MAVAASRISDDSSYLMTTTRNNFFQRFDTTEWLAIHAGGGVLINLHTGPSSHCGRVRETRTSPGPNEDHVEAVGPKMQSCDRSSWVEHVLVLHSPWPCNASVNLLLGTARWRMRLCVCGSNMLLVIGLSDQTHAIAS